MGTSGQHKHKAARIPATDQQRRAWAKAFRADGHVSFAEWAREQLDARAEALGFKSREKVGQESEDE